MDLNGSQQNPYPRPDPHTQKKRCAPNTPSPSEKTRPSPQPSTPAAGLERGCVAPSRSGSGEPKPPTKPRPRGVTRSEILSVSARAGLFSLFHRISWLLACWPVWAQLDQHTLLFLSPFAKHTTALGFEAEIATSSPKAFMALRGSTDQVREMDSFGVEQVRIAKRASE